jgi:hypothetical protein
MRSASRIVSLCAEKSDCFDFSGHNDTFAEKNKPMRRKPSRTPGFPNAKTS